MIPNDEQIEEKQEKPNHNTFYLAIALILIIVLAAVAVYTILSRKGRKH